MRVVTRHAFDVLHRPHGWEPIDSDVDPNRRIVFLASDDRGGGRVRSSWPAAALRELGWNTVVSTGWLGGAAAGDVVVMHRPLTPELYLGHRLSPLACLRSYRAAGARVLVDVDDELEAIPPESGKAATPEQLAEHRSAIAEADGLIVTTRRLELIYGPWARRVFRIANHVPAWVSALGPSPRGDVVRVGWAGTLRSHRADLEWLAPRAREAFAGAVFTTVGDAAAPALLGLDIPAAIASGYERDIATYYARMGACEIGIVPLDNGRLRDWNTSKSDLKVREFLALGKPVVATDLPEQRALLDATGAGLVATTRAGFAERVQQLVHVPALRAAMTAAALRHRERLTLEANVDVWTGPLKEVMAWRHSPR